MKLKIKNFQSISDAEIEFPTGITVIQGESNNGKTAILRAVKAIVTNPSGSGHYVQHGKKSAIVELTNNGETLSWERAKNSTSYKYKDQIFQKTSKQDSNSFCDLGFVRGSKGELLNLSDEWSVLFPFGYSDTELFKLFEDLFAITDSAKVIDGMKGDETSCNKDRLLQQDGLEFLKNRLKLSQDLKSKLKIGQAKLIKQVLTKKLEELKRLKEDLKTVERLNSISKFELTSEPFKTDKLIEIGKQSLELFKACSRASQLPINVELPKMQTFDLNLDAISRLRKSEIEYQQEQRKRENLVVSQAELEKALEDCKALWKTIEQCPLCGGAMKHD